MRMVTSLKSGSRWFRYHAFLPPRYQCNVRVALPFDLISQPALLTGSSVQVDCDGPKQTAFNGHKQIVAITAGEVALVHTPVTYKFFKARNPTQRTGGAHSTCCIYAKCIGCPYSLKTKDLAT